MRSLAAGVFKPSASMFTVTSPLGMNTQAVPEQHWKLLKTRTASVATTRGRVLIAQGRDASDVAISNMFSAAQLTDFRVWTNEVNAAS